MQEQQREWIKSFENKTESELEAMPEPTGLHRLRKDVAARPGCCASPVVGARGQRRGSAAKGVCRSRSLRPGERQHRHGAPRPSVPPQPPLEIPRGNVADLLEQQIGMCAALIGTIADHVALDPSDPSDTTSWTACPPCCRPAPARRALSANCAASRRRRNRLSSRSKGGRGRGSAAKLKTNAMPSTAPQDVVRRCRGGQPGNRNAFTTGVHTKEVRALRKQVTSVRRTMKRLINAAKEELAMR